MSAQPAVEVDPVPEADEAAQPAVLVTGSTGFLGKQVVAAALRAGLRVRTVVRPGTDLASLPWRDHPLAEVARVDLRRRAGLAEALEGCDTVVHLAATKTGDFAARFAGTVVATENLLAAMDTAGVRRLVHCSSFSVYESGATPRHAVLDESAPVESAPAARDDYAQVKIVQERLVHEWAAAAEGRELTVLRPGLIYGPGELWHSLLGVEVLPSLWLGAGLRSTLPMAWVENVADAFVCAAAQHPLAGATVNLVDDRLPSISRYARAVRPLVDGTPRIVQLGYPGARGVVALAAAVNRRWLGGRLKLPGGLSPSPFEARFRPLRYSNQAAKDLLGWRPRYEFPETLQRAATAAPAPERTGG